jgi:hypothetical protein
MNEQWRYLKIGIATMVLFGLALMCVLSATDNEGLIIYFLLAVMVGCLLVLGWLRFSR